MKTMQSGLYWNEGMLKELDWVKGHLEGVKLGIKFNDTKMIERNLKLVQLAMDKLEKEINIPPTLYEIKERGSHPTMKI
jgi:hypothetical protein